MVFGFSGFDRFSFFERVLQLDTEFAEKFGGDSFSPFDTEFADNFDGDKFSPLDNESVK